MIEIGQQQLLTHERTERHVELRGGRRDERVGNRVRPNELLDSLELYDARFGMSGEVWHFMNRKLLHEAKKRGVVGYTDYGRLPLVRAARTLNPDDYDSEAGFEAFVEDSASVISSDASSDRLGVFSYVLTVRDGEVYPTMGDTTETFLAQCADDCKRDVVETLASMQIADGLVNDEYDWGFWLSPRNTHLGYTDEALSLFVKKGQDLCCYGTLTEMGSDWYAGMMKALKGKVATACEWKQVDDLRALPVMGRFEDLEGESLFEMLRRVGPELVDFWDAVESGEAERRTRAAQETVRRLGEGTINDFLSSKGRLTHYLGEEMESIYMDGGWGLRQGNEVGCDILFTQEADRFGLKGGGGELDEMILERDHLPLKLLRNKSYVEEQIKAAKTRPHPKIENGEVVGVYFEVCPACCTTINWTFRKGGRCPYDGCGLKIPDGYFKKPV